MPNNDMLRVCMDLDNIDGISAVAVTSERFWQQNHVMDDGDGPDYGRIEAAMEACGAERLADSYYELPATGFDKLLSDLKRHGIQLVSDPGFTAFLNRNRD